MDCIYLELDGVVSEFTEVHLELEGMASNLTCLTSNVTGLTSDLKGLFSNLTGLTSDLTDLQMELDENLEKISKNFSLLFQIDNDINTTFWRCEYENM